MILWIVSVVLFFLGFKLLVTTPALQIAPLWMQGWGSRSFAAQRLRLRQCVSLFLELEETFAAGLVPASSRWEALKHLPAPWGFLAYDSLQELRASGGAVLPTLRRLRQLAESQDVQLGEARGRSAQATVQAFVAMALVLVFSAVLYFLLPEIQSRRGLWEFGTAVAFVLSFVGGVWIFQMVDQARWGGLPVRSQPWVLATQCAGERLIALIRTGVPPDLAWKRTCDFLSAEAPRLVTDWGFSIWSNPQQKGPSLLMGAESILAQIGGHLRKALHVSLMEGRPCLDRVESILEASRQEWKAQIDREISILPTRALKPLFIFVAPALLGLVAFAFWLTWQAGLGDSFNAV